MHESLYWTVAFAALVGVGFNLRKHVACFWIRSVTNAMWAAVDYLHGIHAQATLQGVYFLLSIYGIWRWSSASKKSEKCTQRR